MKLVIKDDESVEKLDNIKSLLATVIKNQEEVMTQVNEVAAVLTKVNEQLAKAKGEIVGKIDALNAALNSANVSLPADAQVALDSLTAMSQSLDDIVPDVPVVVEPAPVDTPPAA